jgi:uncharacterized protein (UPF0335 family)
MPKSISAMAWLRPGRFNYILKKKPPPPRVMATDHRILLAKMKTEYQQLIENLERLIDEKQELETIKKNIIEERAKFVKRTVELTRKKMELEKKQATEQRRSNTTGGVRHRERKCTQGLWDWEKQA